MVKRNTPDPRQESIKRNRVDLESRRLEINDDGLDFQVPPHDSERHPDTTTRANEIISLVEASRHSEEVAKFRDDLFDKIKASLGERNPFAAKEDFALRAARKLARAEHEMRGVDLETLPIEDLAEQLKNAMSAVAFNASARSKTGRSRGSHSKDATA